MTDTLVFDYEEPLDSWRAVAMEMFDRGVKGDPIAAQAYASLQDAITSLQGAVTSWPNFSLGRFLQVMDNVPMRAERPLLEAMFKKSFSDAPDASQAGLAFASLVNRQIAYAKMMLG